jgi:hypothetical protein
MKLKPVEFARQAGVTKQAISAKIKNQTLIIDAAGFLDTDNPINSAYISDPGRKAKKTALSVQAVPGAATAPLGETATGTSPSALPIPVTDTEIAAAAMVPATELLNYTLREVVMRFGGLYGLEKHIKALRELTATAEREQKMDERAMRLIPKDFVLSGVLAYLNYLNRQLIEYPEMAADKIIPKIISDGPEARDEVILIMRDGISRIIAGAKEQAAKELNGLRGRHGQGGAGRPEEPALTAGPEEASPQGGGSE